MTTPYRRHTTNDTKRTTYDERHKSFKTDDIRRTTKKLKTDTKTHDDGRPTDDTRRTTQNGRHTKTHDDPPTANDERHTTNVTRRTITLSDELKTAYLFVRVFNTVLRRFQQHISYTITEFLDEIPVLPVLIILIPMHQ